MAAGRRAPETVRIDGREIRLTHLDKVFFPGAGLSKGDLVDYYRRVADVMLPYLRDRPLTLHRWPDGLEGEGFYQKHAPESLPEWIARSVQPAEKGTVEYILCNDAATLVWLANFGCITPHVWLSRIDEPDRPDHLVFDLDPSSDDFEPLRGAALLLRERLEERGMKPFAMTTGSRGIHVVVPIRRDVDFESARRLARSIADAVAEERPEDLTTAQRKAKRGKRIFVDYLRNSRGQTAVAPYAVRARPGAPVATPVDWKEVASSSLGPRRYTVQNLFRRLAHKADPWAAMAESPVSVRAAAKRA